MADVKLYDDRHPETVGEEVYEYVRDNPSGEIRTDRDTLAHAFYKACAEVGTAWECLSDAAAAALRTTEDTTAGAQAIKARQTAAAALETAYTFIGLIWETTSGISEAEAESDAVCRSRLPVAPGPYDEFPDDDDSMALAG